MANPIGSPTVEVVTLFPEVFTPFLTSGVIGRALENGVVAVNLHDLRLDGLGRHRSVNDYPYGGGAGMVLRPEPLFAAIEPMRDAGAHIVLLDPGGEQLTDELARQLADYPHLALVCGRYEGVDERVRTLVDREVSIGDYVLTGGELAALVLLDTVVRLMPGVIDLESSSAESFATGLLEHPQYTRPDEFRGMTVPDVLRSGDHAAIARWRRRESLRRTAESRPDLLVGADLDPAERAILDELRA